MTVDILKKTEIWKRVICFYQHSSKEIKQLTGILMNGWNEMIDESLKSEEAIEEGSLDSENTSVVDEEEGITSLDEEAFLETKESKCHQMKKNEVAKPIYTDSSSNRQINSSQPQNSSSGPKMQQKQEMNHIQKRPLVSNDVTVEAKLVSYRQAEGLTDKIEKNSKIEGLTGEIEKESKAEGFTGEIDKESNIVAEILRIKEILIKEVDESVLFESLRRLQPLVLNVDLLKKTEIGKVVNSLRKHSSKEICQLARTLINGWKALVDEWIKSTEAVEAKGSINSVNPSVVDKEKVVPSPLIESKCHQMNKNEVAMRHSKPIRTDYGSSKQTNSSLSQKSSLGTKMQHKQETNAIVKRPLVLDDISVEAKSKATKRKLHESYQQAANAKKQRTIKVVELHDLPKHGNGRRNPHSKL